MSFSPSSSSPPSSPSTSPFSSPASRYSATFNHESQSLLPQHNASSCDCPPLSPKPFAQRSTKFLDGVRGIAAFLVYLHHLAPLFYMEEPHHGFGQVDPATGQKWYHWTGLPFIRLLYTGGDAAVALFFVLSGFVLTIAPLTKIVGMIKEAGGTSEGWRNVMRSVGSATVRRPIRLYLPAFMVAMVYATLRHTPLGPISNFPDLQPTVLEEMGNCFKEFINFFNPFQQHGINHAWFQYGVVVWTIPIELKGSMLVFLLTALYAFASQSRFYRRLYFIQLIVLSLLLLLLNQWTMSLFAAGMVLALCDIYRLHLTSLPLLNRLSKNSTPVVNHLTLLTGLYFLSQPSHKSTLNYSLLTPGWHLLTTLIPTTYLTPSGEVSWFDPEYFRFWTSIGGVLTLYSLLRIRWTQQLFSKPVPMYLGRISFALYLTHVTVQTLTGFLLRMVGQWAMGDKWYDNKLYLPEWGPMGLSIRYLGAIALQVPIVLLVAHVGTVIFDQPALKVAHKVASWMGLSSERKIVPVVLKHEEQIEEKDWRVRVV